MPSSTCPYPKHLIFFVPPLYLYFFPSISLSLDMSLASALLSLSISLGLFLFIFSLPFSKLLSSLSLTISLPPLFIFISILLDLFFYLLFSFSRSICCLKKQSILDGLLNHSFNFIICSLYCEWPLRCLSVKEDAAWAIHAEDGTLVVRVGFTRNLVFGEDWVNISSVYALQSCLSRFGIIAHR